LRLLLSVPAGGGGAASSVAGGQDPVLRPRRGGWYQVTVSLLPPLQPPQDRSAGDWAWRSFDLLWNATCVNSCRICSDAHNIGRYWFNNRPFFL